jgi:hypothetical protein
VWCDRLLSVSAFRLSRLSTEKKKVNNQKCINTVFCFLVSFFFFNSSSQRKRTDFTETDSCRVCAYLPGSYFNKATVALRARILGRVYLNRAIAGVAEAGRLPRRGRSQRRWSLLCRCRRRRRSSGCLSSISIRGIRVTAVWRRITGIGFGGRAQKNRRRVESSVCVWHVRFAL